MIICATENRTSCAGCTYTKATYDCSTCPGFSPIGVEGTLLQKETEFWSQSQEDACAHWSPGVYYLSRDSQVFLF